MSRTPRLLIHPEHRRALHEAGLVEPADFLALTEEIVSGHPDRQVGRVRIGDDVAYLKRELRVPLKERLLNWWSGHGLASKSRREGTTLLRLQDKLDCLPEWMAFGETRGQAFLLLREIRGVPLSVMLDELPEDGRRELASMLGYRLSCLHALGCIHGDLFAPHVLIERETLRPVFLDWQRAGPGRGERDLAALTATLPSTARSAEFLRDCLSQYAADMGLSLRDLVVRVEKEAASLSRRRHVQAKARAGRSETTSLLCLDGDALRVTPAFRRLWPNDVPSFLRETEPVSMELVLPDGSRGRLERSIHRLSWFHRRGSRRRTWTSPERQRMNRFHRSAQLGLAAPEVLAEGEREIDRATVSAFLFVRLPLGDQP